MKHTHLFPLLSYNFPLLRFLQNALEVVPEVELAEYPPALQVLLVLIPELLVDVVDKLVNVR